MSLQYQGDYGVVWDSERKVYLDPDGYPLTQRQTGTVITPSAPTQSQVVTDLSLQGNNTTIKGSVATLASDTTLINGPNTVISSASTLLNGANTVISSASTLLSGTTSTISSATTTMSGALTRINGTAYSNTSLFRGVYSASSDFQPTNGVFTDIPFDVTYQNPGSNIAVTTNTKFANNTGRTIIVNVEAFSQLDAAINSQTNYYTRIGHFLSNGTALAYYGIQLGEKAAGNNWFNLSSISCIRMAPNDYITWQVNLSYSSGTPLLRSGASGSFGRYLSITQIG